MFLRRFLETVIGATALAARGIEHLEQVTRDFSGLEARIEQRHLKLYALPQKLGSSMIMGFKAFANSFA